jgi:hypothetical protein
MAEFDFTPSTPIVGKDIATLEQYSAARRKQQADEQETRIAQETAKMRNAIQMMELNAALKSQAEQAAQERAMNALLGYQIPPQNLQSEVPRQPKPQNALLEALQKQKPGQPPRGMLDMMGRNVPNQQPNMANVPQIPGPAPQSPFMAASPQQQSTQLASASQSPEFQALMKQNPMAAQAALARLKGIPEQGKMAAFEAQKAETELAYKKAQTQKELAEARKVGDPLQKANKEELTRLSLYGETQDIKDKAKRILDDMTAREVRVSKEKKDSGKDTSSNWRTWDDEAKNLAVEDYIMTRKRPFAYGDRENNAAFQKYAFTSLAKAGIKESDLLSMTAEQKADAASLVGQQKGYDMASSYVKNMNSQLKEIKALLDKNVSRLGVRGADAVKRWGLTTLIGSSEEQKVSMILLDLSNEAGKLSSGSQQSVRQLSDSAADHWNKIHDPNLSIEDLKKVIDETGALANMRLDSLKSQKEETQARIKGRPSVFKGSKPAPSAGSKTDLGGGYSYEVVQ